ncbi:right-handed parallel beta-helix repeat-containing protein [Pontiella sulfatireligans]|nr:right-handed parallel beta-helix repeat-containing protein [Pontiella sulfatireligans]
MKNLTIIAGMLCTASAYAAEFYVATTGSDVSPGTLERPFASLQTAAQKMSAGDICFVRGGTYFQPLEIEEMKGAADHPFIFRAYQNETVVLDGTASITPDWDEWEDGIVKTAVEQDMWQLFEGNTPVDLARWPNASVSDGSIWDVHKSMRSTDRKWDNKLGRSESVTQPGIVFDRNHEGFGAQTLAETGKDFSGAIAVLNIGHWLTWARPVLEHKAGSNQFTYDPEGTRMLKFLEYCLYGLPALDHENEWWFDAKTKTLYFKPAPGQKPDLRGKVRDFNLVARNCAHVQFIGIDFFATTFLLDECENMLIEDSQLLYPSTHKFVLGELGWFSNKPPADGGNAMTLIYNSGEGDCGNVVRNCSIEYPNSPAIGLFSSGAVLENCYVHDVEWVVNSSGGAGALAGGDRVTVKNCTLHTTGASEGIRLGAGSTIEGNHIYNTSLLQHDGSAINIGTPSQPGTVARRNWVHDTKQQAMRFDSTTSTFGTDAAVVENVFFNVQDGTGGNKFKGDYQLFAKNTAFDCFVAIPKGFGATDVHNEHTLVCNNLVDHLVEWNMKSRTNGIPAEMMANMSGEGSVRRLLRDPDNFDFRPKKNVTGLIDQGVNICRADLPGEKIRFPGIEAVGQPDIGAYEAGAATYWIPGCRMETAATPVPKNGAQHVPLDTDLMFLHAYKMDSHKIYFGTSPDALKPIAEIKGFSNIVDPPELEPDKTYYWRVGANTGESERLSNVWKFTTGEGRSELAKASGLSF